MSTVIEEKQVAKAIEFIDLTTQQAHIRGQIDKAIKKVLDHGQYIMGPEVAALEKELSSFCGAKNAITCSNGTDALALILRAKGLKPKDAVFVPSFTFAATAEVVAWFNAEVVFVDVLPNSFNMDPNSLKQGIQKAIAAGLKPTAIMPVDLFGLPAEYDEIETIAEENNLWILSDAAQSFGASYKSRKVGTLGEATSTSFFPAKPLGCYGDGGCIFTDNDELAEVIRSLRVHGKGYDKYDNVRIGMNGRLDTLQAAILLEKLRVFPQEIQVRQQAAEFYHAALEEYVKVPRHPTSSSSTWAQYTIQLKNPALRDNLMAALKADGVPSVVYYPKPLHQQTAYKNYLRASDRLVVSENLSDVVLSLPMHGYLTKEDQHRIVLAIQKNLEKI